jgi:hypothetical protein
MFVETIATRMPAQFFAIVSMTRANPLMSVWMNMNNGEERANESK